MSKVLRDSREVEPLASRKGKQSEGLVVAQVAPGEKDGCLLELRFQRQETRDSKLLREFARDLCTQILKCAPLWVCRNDIPWERVRAEERRHRSRAEREFATSERIEDYLVERMSLWYSQVCLMEQPFYRDPSRLVGQVWQSTRRLLGDELEVCRFERYTIDEKVAPSGTAATSR